MSMANHELIMLFEHNKHEKGFSMPVAHVHNHYEIYYLMSGRSKYIIGSEIFLLKPGDFVIVPKGELHRTEGIEDNGAERILLMFDDSFVSDEYRSYLDTLAGIKHISLPESKAHVFVSLLKKIEKEQGSSYDDCYMMQRLYVCQMLLLLARYKQDVKRQKISATHRLILEAAQYISQNYNQDLNLELLAQKYAISAGHFSKLFKRVTGVKVSEYITMARITAAQHMLAAGEKNITAVATSCGYNDSNYFSRVFKQVLDVTPKKYAMQFM